MHSTVVEQAEALRVGETSAEGLARACLERATDPSGQGSLAFVGLDCDKVIDQARSSDLLRHHRIVPGPLAGIPVSVKDILDVAGEVTRAGSRVAGTEPASRDAVAVSRLRACGAVITGRTNMTEFAYSGVGLNPHYGTPTNPHDRATGRIPGGSSSGGAVSVTDGMALAAVGTDTGGSCRIPAALCGIVGFKPTARRVPLEGCMPLSISYDSVGCLGRSVSCVSLVNAAMAQDPVEIPRPLELDGLRLGIAEELVMDGLDESVANAFSRALSRLSRGGAHVRRMSLPELQRVPDLARDGGIVAAEAYAWHCERIAEAGDRYDPRVRARILMGERITSRDYIALLEERRRMIESSMAATREFDAIVMPTVPIVAPPLSAFDSDDEFARLNKLLLRNPSTANALDRCAVSLPCHDPGELPVGLTLMGERGGDERLLRVAAAVEGAGISQQARPGAASG